MTLINVCLTHRMRTERLSFLDRYLVPGIEALWKKASMAVRHDRGEKVD